MVSQPLGITSSLDRPPLRIRSDTASYSRKVRWTKRNEDNYQTIQGIGLDEIRGVAKASVKGTEIGCARLFHASNDDA